MSLSVSSTVKDYFLACFQSRPPETTVALCFPPLRHPLPEIQVCEIGRRGGGRGKGETIRNEELLCIALSGLSQHLPAVLDDDAAGFFSNAAAVKTVTDGFCRSESGGADAEDSVGVIEDARRRAAGP